MTFVGKILVIVIMICSVIFFGLTVVAFVSTTNWREAFTEQKKKNDDLQKQVNDNKTLAETRANELAKAQADHKAEVDQLNAQIKDAQAKMEDQQKKAEDVTKQLEVAQQTAKDAAADALARAKDTDTLKENLSAAQKQANEFKLQQTDLNERLRVLERELNVAKANNTTLRENLTAYVNFLNSKGLPTDPVAIRNMSSNVATAPPDVEGQVARVDPRNETAEITIGSDDGVAEGQEYFIFRTGGTSEYVGKLRILATEPDKAVGRVVSHYLGRKVQEKDIVASKIRPRS